MAIQFIPLLKKAKKYFPDLNEKRLKKAFDFAKKAHQNQTRRDLKTPYLTHPLATANLLTEFRVDEETLIAALLHDVVEDTPYKLKEIEKEFGGEIAFLVDGVTKLSKLHYRDTRTVLHVESLKKLFLCSAQDLRIILIKLADRLHNMRTLENVPERKRQLRMAKETMEIYVPIANLLGIWAIKRELEDLCFKHLFPREYLSLKNRLTAGKEKRAGVLAGTAKIIKKTLNSSGIKAEIEGREKNLYSIFKKVVMAGISLKEIEDLIALRVIVPREEDCYQVLGVIHQLFKPKPYRLKDYIAVPKANGYRSLHTTIFGPKGILIEFHIRTPEMHLEDEYGIAACYWEDQFKKKKKVKITDFMQKKSDWISKILELQRELKDSFDFLENLKLDVFQDRIFVFTPKGEVIDLPRGACAVDFAYHIHTDIGHQAVRAEINGKETPLITALQTGDTVRIVTVKKGTKPNREWLDYVKTNLAANKIKNYFQTQSKEKNLEIGQKILQKELDRLGKEKIGKIPALKFKKLFKIFRVKNLQELLTSIGDGTIGTQRVIRILFAPEELLGIPEQARKGKHVVHPDIHPLKPGGDLYDKKTVRGYLKEKKRSRRITGKIYPVRIFIGAKDRVGLLRDVSTTLAELGINIQQVSVNLEKETDEASLEILIEVRNFDQLNSAFLELQKIPGIIEVCKK